MIDSPPSVLILGGTAEARELARSLNAMKIRIVSSLAGRVSAPALPVGEVRIGGFGGVSGLIDYLRPTTIRVVVDATHPFAAAMSANVIAACGALGLPLVRLSRPGWGELPEASGWQWVSSHPEACQRAATIADRVFLTIGRQTLADYLPLADRFTLVRVVEAPTMDLPSRWQLIKDRGPYTLDGELSVLKRSQIGVLVTKDSGGDYTRAKLDAAAAVGVPVVVVRRPRPPSTTTATVLPAANAADAVARITELIGRPG